KLPRQFWRGLEIPNIIDVAGRRRSGDDSRFSWCRVGRRPITILARDRRMDLRSHSPRRSMMQWHAIGAVARHAAIVTGISAGMLTGFPTAADVGAQPRGHSIYMTAVEFRGSTSTDKLAPPSIDP